jgi:HEAT repeat protein
MMKPTLTISTILACLACAALPTGCGGGHRSAAKVNVVPSRTLAPEDFRLLQSIRSPGDLRDACAKLVADLASGDMVRAWHAEEALAALGEEAIPYARSAAKLPVPEARAAGCRLIYRLGDKASVPTLIDLLADESSLVRVEASVNLSGLTNQDFNFRANSALSERQEAISRWRAWYRRTYGARRR